MRTYGFAGGSIDITPQHPIPLAGYVDRTRSFRRVASPLEANAVLLTGQGSRVLFMSADLLFCGREVLEAVEERAERFGLTRAQVMLTASHTHFAPGADRSKPLIGSVDDEYQARLIGQLCALVDTVMKADPVPVSMVLRRVTTDLNVNRRRRWHWPTVTRAGITVKTTVVMAPDFHGDRDAAIDVIRLVDGDGDVVAVLWKYACHPVCYPDELEVSAEYPGEGRAKVRRRLGRNVPVVFWQGFAGDQRPRLVGAASLREHLATLRRGPSFRTISPDEWSPWSDAVGDTLLSGMAGDGLRIGGALSVADVDIPLLSLLPAEGNPHLRLRTLRLQRVSLGIGPVLLFVSAEVCSPYLRFLADGEDTILIGYTGDVFGYLPSERQAREGGYEGRGFFKSFGLRGPWRAGFERVVTEAAGRLRRHARGTNQSMSSSMG